MEDNTIDLGWDDWFEDIVKLRIENIPPPNEEYIDSLMECYKKFFESQNALMELEKKGRIFDLKLVK